MEEVLRSSEAELNLFEGMDGFEKFNPLDDSSLLAILDDLEEGTLLSLLGNESLVSDFSGEMNSFPFIMESVSQPERDVEELYPSSPIAINELAQKQRDVENDPSAPLLTVATDQLSTLPGQTTRTVTDDDDTLCNTLCKPLNPMKRSLPQSPAKSPLKRAKLETDDLLSSVRHDHSYAAASACHVTSGRPEEKTLRTPAGSSSDEEGSLSDAGMLSYVWFTLTALVWHGG